MPKNHSFGAGFFKSGRINFSFLAAGHLTSEKEERIKCFNKHTHGIPLRKDARKKQPLLHGLLVLFLFTISFE